ncbi:MAG: 2-oxoacid:acceptor oxidoreductase family protein [Candidatus Bathyarchaeia archaeon]
MRVEVRFCGVGGQGVVLAGQILGRAAAYEGKHVVQTQTYGAEARGSAAKSEVIISENKIGFPLVRECDVLVVMSQEALEKNLKDLKEDGTLIIDSDSVRLIPETRAKTVKIPATSKAEEWFGLKLYANMLMLGALTRVTSIVSEKSLEKAIEDTGTAKDAEMNKKALLRGKELV